VFDLHIRENLDMLRADLTAVTNDFSAARSHDSVVIHDSIDKNRCADEIAADHLCNGKRLLIVQPAAAQAERQLHRAAHCLGHHTDSRELHFSHMWFQAEILVFDHDSVKADTLKRFGIADRARDYLVDCRRCAVGSGQRQAVDHTDKQLASARQIPFHFNHPS